MGGNSSFFWAEKVAVKARCLSLEILRGRPWCKGGGERAALRAPLVIGIGGIAEDDSDGEVGA